jgi:prepilin-type N-terminal cleavage/methylation domain-containing protein
MLTFARRLRSDDDGFSLIELLTSMVIGGIILTALMTVVQRAVSSTVQTSDRVEALQHGRSTMDRMTTLLNSQTCLLKSDGTGVPPIIVGDVNQIVFYASLGAVDTQPSIYRLTYNPTNRRITQDRYAPVTTGTDPTYPSYPASPAQTTVIGTNVLPETSGAPIFQYWEFVTDEGPTLGMIDPTPLTPALDATEQSATVRVTVGFVAQPDHTSSNKPDPRATTLEGVGIVGSANAGEPTKGVNC